MGGVSGAVSTKIAIQAGLLLLSARIDHHPVQAMLDPSAPHTRIAPDLARRLRAADGSDDDDRTIGGYHAIGIDRHEVRLRTVRIERTDAPAPLVIGNDLLRDSPLELDLAHDRLHLLERRGVARAARGMVRLPLAVAPSGCLEVTATRADGRPAILALAPGGAGGDAVPVRLGTAGLTASTPGGGHACSAGSLALGWAALGRARLIVDLPGGALWIAPAA